MQYRPQVIAARDLQGKAWVAEARPGTIRRTHGHGNLAHQDFVWDNDLQLDTQHPRGRRRVANDVIANQIGGRQSFDQTLQLRTVICRMESAMPLNSSSDCSARKQHPSRWPCRKELFSLLPRGNADWPETWQRQLGLVVTFTVANVVIGQIVRGEAVHQPGYVRHDIIDCVIHTAPPAQVRGCVAVPLHDVIRDVIKVVRPRIISIVYRQRRWSLAVHGLRHCSSARTRRDGETSTGHIFPAAYRWLANGYVDGERRGTVTCRRRMLRRRAADTVSSHLPCRVDCFSPRRPRYAGDILYLRSVTTMNNEHRGAVPHARRLRPYKMVG
jgi:hypothetical protein